MTTYDIIGDVHGQFGKLDRLLRTLGWEPKGDRYVHPDPDRKSIFVGDLVDRGPGQKRVLVTVRSMIESGDAQMVMGNHEFNAIAWATAASSSDRGYLRPHSAKNRNQHRAFLRGLTQLEQRQWIAWFRTLPLWLDLGDLRIVHACWHEESIEVLRTAFGGDRLPDDVGVLAAAADKRTSVGAAIEVVLKGPERKCEELKVPAFLDGEHTRSELRLRWWNRFGTKMNELLDPPKHALALDGKAPYPPIPDRPHSPAPYHYVSDVPVVFGHHWREWPKGVEPHWRPIPGVDWSPNAACVDFSAGKDGPLVAYQWQGETEIDREHYISSGHD